MENLPVIIVVGDNAPALIAGVESAKKYISASIAANTARAYKVQWASFARWCSVAGRESLPAMPDTVAAYLSSMADNGKKTSTIDSARAAIRKAHETAGLDDPTSSRLVKITLQGIRREKGTAPAQKAPAISADIKAMCAMLPDTLIGKRDKALLLVGFAGGFRRSELVGVTVENIEDTPEGIIIHLLKSKTDQEGKGRLVGIRRSDNPATCPVRALLAWVSAAGIISGQVFRAVDRHGKIRESLTAQSIALVVKAACNAAGLDSTKYSGHSLRAGLVTQAAKNKASVTDIMRQTGHKSTETVNRYIRKANIFEDNVSGIIGL